MQIVKRGFHEVCHHARLKVAVDEYLYPVCQPHDPPEGEDGDDDAHERGDCRRAIGDGRGRKQVKKLFVVKRNNGFQNARGSQ